MIAKPIRRGITRHAYRSRREARVEKAKRAINHAMSLIQAENEKAKSSKAFEWIVIEWLNQTEGVYRPPAMDVGNMDRCIDVLIADHGVSPFEDRVRERIRKARAMTAVAAPPQAAE